MIHPFAWIPERNRKPVFLAFLAGSLMVLFLFQPLNRPLMTAPAPSGIISLQLAWTAGNAAGMLASWDASARLFAAFGLGFDYLFMLVYALALALGTLLASARHPGIFQKLGSWAAYASLLAAFLDALENLGQFQQIFHDRLDLAPAIGFLATAKFVLIFLGLTYGLAGWFWPKKQG